MRKNDMTAYEQYADTQRKIDALETMKESLRTQISAELPEDGYKDDSINVFWTAKKSWKYSPKVEGLTAELKATKKKEEEDGVALAEETKQLTTKVRTP